MKKISTDDIEGATDMLRRYSSIDWGEYNDQYRICFHWAHGDATEVERVDYH